MKTVERTLQMLDLFLEQGPQLSVNQVHDALHIPKSIASRTLKSLYEYGYLARDPVTRLYQPGLRLFQLGVSGGYERALRASALTAIVHLARQIGETVNLLVPDLRSGRGICIESVEGPDGNRFSMQIGRAGFLHAGASRKILLAYMPPEQIQAVINRVGLPALTPQTITDPALLKEDLAQIRKQGWAVSFEESDIGGTGIAAPIYDRTGRAVASLATLVPTFRATQERVNEVLHLTRQAAAHVSSHLGYTPVADQIAKEV